MSPAPPILHLFCGKMASGKSTLAAELARSDGAVLISEDTWLNALFADELSSGSDYVRCAAKLRAAIGPHVSSLLNAGMPVVLDFPANTLESRAWMRGILETTKAPHQLHVLLPPDEVCLKRLRDRNDRGDHPFAATEAQFHRFSKYFHAPTPEEGFNTVLHRDH